MHAPALQSRVPERGQRPDRGSIGRPRRRTGLRLGLDERGNISVELAVVGPLFLLLLLAIIELGLMVYTQSVLDSAARDAARLIRTGQVYTAGNTQATFQTKLCNGMSVLVDCSSLVFNVRTFASFSSITTTPQRDAQGKLVSGFSPGTAASILEVQVMYNRPFVTSWVAHYLGGGQSSALLVSTVIFKNEPWPTA
jgi:Flp pilus assembly protein TadG